MTVEDRERRQRWTPEQVEERLVEWADTLRKMPDRERGWLYGSGVCWPATLPDQGEVFANAVANGGRHEDMPEPFVPATRAAIARFWETSEWFGLIPNPRDRKVVAAVAMSLTRRHQNVSWAFVRRTTGLRLHPRTLSRIYEAALERVVAGLNTGCAPCPAIPATATTSSSWASPACQAPASARCRRWT